MYLAATGGGGGGATAAACGREVRVVTGATLVRRTPRLTAVVPGATAAGLGPLRRSSSSVMWVRALTHLSVSWAPCSIHSPSITNVGTAVMPLLVGLGALGVHEVDLGLGRRGAPPPRSRSRPTSAASLASTAWSATSSPSVKYACSSRCLSARLLVGAVLVERPGQQPVGVERVGPSHPAPAEVDAQVGPGRGQPGVGGLHPAQVAELPLEVVEQRGAVVPDRHPGVELEGPVDDVDLDPGLLHGPPEPLRSHVAPRTGDVAPDVHVHVASNTVESPRLPSVDTWSATWPTTPSATPRRCVSLHPRRARRPGRAHRRRRRPGRPGGRSRAHLRALRPRRRRPHRPTPAAPASASPSPATSPKPHGGTLVLDSTDAARRPLRPHPVPAALTLTGRGVRVDQVARDGELVA